MRVAWYAHLKNPMDRLGYYAAVASRGTGLFEYLPQVPGKRSGYGQLARRG